MGIERDYLMRQLKMLFEVIQRILHYRKKGEKEQAMEEIKTFYHYLNITENVHTMSIEALLNLLVTERKLTNSQLEMVALVLKEQGELADNAEQQLDFFSKAYFFLEKVERESTSFSMDRQMKLAELREYLD